MAEDPRSAFTIAPVGIVRSPFQDKFGAPRQAGLIAQAVGEVELLNPYDAPAMLDGLVEFSHLWLVFRFDRVAAQGWRQRVRPPRLGGNREVGVWASRSPFRPNHLGLSAVRLLAIEAGPPALLRVAGLDMVDGTPVVDIKPYIPYADALPEASGAYAAAPPEPTLSVDFSAGVEHTLALMDPDRSLRRLVEQVIALDPRPAYRRHPDPARHYGMRIADVEVRWRVVEGRAEVTELFRPDC